MRMWSASTLDEGNHQSHMRKGGLAGLVVANAVASFCCSPYSDQTEKCRLCWYTEGVEAWFTEPYGVPGIFVPAPHFA